MSCSGWILGTHAKGLIVHIGRSNYFMSGGMVDYILIVSLSDICEYVNVHAGVIMYLKLRIIH